MSRRAVVAAVESSRRAVVAAAERLCHAGEAENYLPRASEISHKRIRLGGKLNSLAYDGLLGEVRKQKEMIADLLELLEKIKARTDKATSLVEQLFDDKAGLRDDCDELKEEAAGWKNMHEKSRASGKELKALAEELMDEVANLRIKNLELEEKAEAARMQAVADVKESVEAHRQKNHTMEAMKKMTEERREEEKAMEAMKEKLEQLRASTQQHP
jgi:chromosome segregation ATPase